MEHLALLESIQEDLKKMNKRLGMIEDSCDDMNRHISFVEYIYDTVKSKFHSIFRLSHTVDPHNDAFTMKTIKDKI
jgi:hypothetical protein